MTDMQWTELRGEILGLWGSASQEQNDRRLAVLEKRFKKLSYPHFRGVVTELERKAGGRWPTIDHWHAAVETIRNRTELARTGQKPKDTPDNPMSAADWAAGARLLVQGANDHLRRGNPDGNPRHRWLLNLAEFWEENAARVGRGEDPAWPPPPAPERAAPFLARVGADIPTGDDVRERARRTRHLPPDAEEIGCNSDPMT